MLRPTIALAVLAALSAPAHAADEVPADLAEGRLRGCLLAGATSPGQADLAAKVIEVRAFCGAQINHVRSQRVAAATSGLSGDEAQAAEAAATRALNDEIARAVANFSGLTL